MSNDQLLDEFLAVRNKTVEISLPLTTEELAMQPAEFASPLKWHLAHTTWFFEAFILIDYVKNYRCIDDKYLFLFNSYYHQKGEKLVRKNRGFIGRPTIQEVLNYREAINEAISKNWQLIKNQNIQNLIKTGIEHEKQHQELMLYDLQYLLYQNPLRPAYDKNFKCLQNHKEPVVSRWLNFDEQITNIGANSEIFHYDNEEPLHRTLIHDFSISTSLVTNQDMINFIKEGGYQNPLLWLDEAWSYIQNHNISSPYYWSSKISNDEPTVFSLNGENKVDPTAPLQSISFYEADALARFLNNRLPTEFELELASKDLNQGLLWEWSQSAYLPYPGYKTAEGALGEYNGKFMVNQKVLRGGSYASPENHIRSSYRNFFHPNLSWMYSGLRLCKI